MSSNSPRRVTARTFRTLVAFAAITAAGHSFAEETYDGYLCCNMRTDGSWISDANYAESGKRLVPVGTPARVTGHGRYRVNVLIDDKRQSIGNDYSRDLDLDTFARRYVVKEDPTPKIAGYPAKVREAIKQAKVSPGMTREQVLMALGYPMSSENPDLNANLWRFWLSSFAEFQVQFDATGRVAEITTDPGTRNLVWMP